VRTAELLENYLVVTDNMNGNYAHECIAKF